MKLGLLDFDMTVESYWESSWNHKALLNIGDAAEYLVIEQIYSSLNISEREFVRLSIKDLINYRGESLIVALNIALDSYVGYNEILENLSPDIIPVFLGISITDTHLNDKQIECLRQYAPIGCRDQRSYSYVRDLGIPCYLNGCTASALKILGNRKREFEGKILFIDVPHGVLEYIPEELKSEIIFLNQELYCKKSEFLDKVSPSLWAQQIFECYNSNPKMIVTSRFHGAVIGLACEIPTIITLEKYTFRFSWLKNYFSIYTEGNFRDINWNAIKPNYRSTRDLILKISRDRISSTMQKYGPMLSLTDLQKVPNIENESNGSNQVIYYQKAWNKIQKIWDPEKEYIYAFWGINDNSKKLFSLISQNFPYAKLVDIYDMFKEVSFHGIHSCSPQEMGKRAAQDNYFVIATAYLAARVVPDICSECGFPEARVICCERDFIDHEDLR